MWFNILIYGGSIIGIGCVIACIVIAYIEGGKISDADIQALKNKLR